MTERIPEIRNPFVKTFMIPAALAIVLAGCDEASVPHAYTPEMASFSN